MNPNPLLSLNHLTVPWAITNSLSIVRRATHLTSALLSYY